MKSFSARPYLKEKLRAVLMLSKSMGAANVHGRDSVNYTYKINLFRCFRHIRPKAPNIRGCTRIYWCIIEISIRTLYHICTFFALHRRYIGTYVHRNVSETASSASPWAHIPVTRKPETARFPFYGSSQQKKTIRVLRRWLVLTRHKKLSYSSPLIYTDIVHYVYTFRVWPFVCMSFHFITEILFECKRACNKTLTAICKTTYHTYVNMHLDFNMHHRETRCRATIKRIAVQMRYRIIKCILTWNT